MPMPISISSSASSKLGSPEAGVTHGVSAMPMLRPWPLTLRHSSATSASDLRSLAGAGGVQHPDADEAAVHRLVPRAAARDNAHLALHRRIGAHDHGGVADHADLVAVGQLDALERLLDDRAGIVDQLLHACPPVDRPQFRAGTYRRAAPRVNQAAE